MSNRHQRRADNAKYVVGKRNKKRRFSAIASRGEVVPLPYIFHREAAGLWLTTNCAHPFEQAFREVAFLNPDDAILFRVGMSSFTGAGADESLMRALRGTVMPQGRDAER